MGSFKLLIHFDIYSTENSRKRTYLMFNLNFIDFCEDMLESDASNKLGQGQEKLGKLWNALKNTCFEHSTGKQRFIGNRC